ncbi:hypothetical protein RRG08_062763 [Elysia crispata]|uniref:Regulating synaptic membrane exocytosis protein 2 n=1 Tax=Elysia crispata TaxID=231223 RepID=A0AAE1E8H3_9GAST|nr:hypothetical protein RRG08_062763 [Elysia crispata]
MFTEGSHLSSEKVTTTCFLYLHIVLSTYVQYTALLFYTILYLVHHHLPTGELESVGGSVGSGRRRAVKSSLTKARLETLAKPTLYDTGRGTSLETESGSSEPQVKDSGNDTGMSSSSNQTINTVDDAAAAAAAAVAGAMGGGGGAGSVETGSAQRRHDPVSSTRRQAKLLSEDTPARRLARPVAEQTMSRRRAKHPVTWQSSADGSKWIGHMILKKTVLESGGEKRDSSAILGLKVIGGTASDTGKLGAFITKVKKGSIADTVGHLRPGDEVVEWNGRSLQGATYEEVYDIILESKQEPQVELIVHRSAKHGETPPGVQSSFTEHARDYGLKDAIPDNQRTRRPVVPEPQPRSRVRSRPLSPPITGKLQVKLWYDVQSYQLIITVINAIDLPLTDGGKFRDPYCKIYLLPDRSEKSKRRTKTVSSTIDPTWNQTFMYCPVKESDLHDRLLEITVWDYDRVGASEFLGEILIDLTTANLNDEPYWYQLDHHDNTSIPLPASSPRTKNSQDPYDLRKDHLSPPVSTRGLSDSDMSELDFDDGVGVVPGAAGGATQTAQSRAAVDGQGSLSSVGSSCSPTTLGSGEISDASSARQDADSSTTICTAGTSVTHRSRSSTVVGRDDLGRQRHASAADKLEVPEHGGSSGQRSRSPNRESSFKSSSRTRSKSPGHMRIVDSSRSLSPSELRPMPPGTSSQRSFAPASSRSVGGTPTSTPSPKKRQLPAIPLEAQKASRDRVTQDLEERTRHLKMKMKLAQQDRQRTPTSSSGMPSDAESISSRPIRRRDRHSSADPSLNERGGKDRMGGHDRSISHDRVERMREKNYERGRDPDRPHHRPRRHKEFSPDMSDDVGSDVSETSDMSEVSKVSTISVRSTQSERPRRKLSEFASKMESRTTIPQKRQQQPAVVRSTSNDSNQGGFEQNDGSVSDSALGASVTEGRKRRPSIPHKMAALVGLTRRSSSASQLAGT